MDGLRPGRHSEAQWVPHSSTAHSNVLYILSASDDVRPSKRVGRSIGGRRNHSRVHNNQSPARKRRPRELAERKKQAAGVAAARNYNAARERGKAQSYLCQRLSAQ
jgi:hypothetical protein